MNETSVCPKCGAGLLSPNAPHRGWECGSCHNSPGQSPRCRIRELTAQLAARDAALLAVDGELAKAQAELGVARAEIACLRTICDGTDFE